MNGNGWVEHYVWSTHQHVNPTIIFSSTHLFEWSQLLMNRSNITWTCFSENQSFNTIVLFKTLNKNYNTLNLSQWWLNDDNQLVCVSLSKVNRTKQSRLNDNLQKLWMYEEGCPIRNRNKITSSWRKYM